jgi:hypothetical protein
MSRLEECNKLTQKILAATDDVDDINAIFDALASSFIFFMAMVCSDCRRNIADNLKEGLLEMMRKATALAKDYKADAGKGPVCRPDDTHH